MKAFSEEFLLPPPSQVDPLGEAMSLQVLFLRRILDKNLERVFFLKYRDVRIFYGGSVSFLRGFSFWARRSHLKQLPVLNLLLQCLNLKDRQFKLFPD